ncbi:MAG: putative selenium-dependent hydroxylase accessory protein YqeC, partial [Oscillospiraceae bacterium]
VIAVLGLTGLGRPIAEAAHRSERYAGLVGCTPEDIATPERAARVLEAEALHTRVLLNQADAADGTALLARLHCPAALASLRKGEIVSCSF